jgi:peptide/nickel transport system substrate-binding protein
VAESFWANWHPFLHTAQIQGRIQRQIFDRLVEIETQDFSKVAPSLATSWQQLDERTWEFKLKQGVKFHGGQDFTAEDVKATIELASGATPIQTNSASRWVPTTGEIVDKYTVRLKPSKPFAAFLLQLADTDIVSADDVKKGTDAMKAAPNGTGPFKVVTDDKDRKVMEAHTSYWRGVPKIKTLIWEFIQDSQTRLSALLAGQAQVIDRVPPEHFQVLKGSANISLSSVAGLENVNLWIRQDRPPFAENVKLRQALAWSVDREALTKNLVGGAAEVARTHIPNHALFAKPQLPAYGFDPDKAKKLLGEAGYASGGPEFILWGTTGFLPRAKEVTEAVADSLKKVGMKPTVTITDVAGIIDALFSDKKPGSVFHLSWSGNGDPHRSLATLYRSPGAWTGAHDPKVDELIDRGVQTTKDADRQKVYEELQAYLWDNMPHVPLYNSDFTIAHVKALKDLRVLPNFNTYFYPASLTQ